MRRTSLMAMVAMVALVAGCGTATLLPDGRVLLMDLVVKAYDPTTHQVTNLSTPPTPRAFATATLLQDGHVLIVGGTSSLESAVSVSDSGTDTSSPPLASADLYDPATDTYTPTGSMARPRAFHTATLLKDGRVLIVGGSGASGETSQTGETPSVELIPPPEIYDPATGTFAPAGGDTVIPRVLATATLLQDGRVLIAGGVTATLAAPATSADPAASPGTSPQGAPTDQAELYDPATGTFSATGSMTSPRLWHTASALDDGRVLIVGGTKDPDITNSTGVDPTARSAELYDPSSGTFSATAAPGKPRMGHAAALLDDGRVLITGGLEVDSATQESLERSAELFDSHTETFVPTGNMVTGHAFHTATPVGAGLVLVAGISEQSLSGLSGGSTPDLLASAELFDEATGTFATLEVEPAVLPSPPSPG